MPKFLNRQDENASIYVIEISDIFRVMQQRSSYGDNRTAAK
jgi:hypothetical protein